MTPVEYGEYVLIKKMCEKKVINNDTSVKVASKFVDTYYVNIISLL